MQAIDDGRVAVGVAVADPGDAVIPADVRSSRITADLERAREHSMRKP
jgi:hypothetical protein